MTVKMTSAKSRCVVSGVVFLMTFLMAQCVPLDFTTSRYKEEKLELHDSSSLPLPSLSNSNKVPQIFDIFDFGPNFFLAKNDSDSLTGRRSKSPENGDFQFEEILRNFRTVNFTNNDSFFGNKTPSGESDDESRKFSNKKNSALYSNFERNTVKTTKNNKNNSSVKTSNEGNKTLKQTNRTKSNSSLYTNFVRKPIRNTQTLQPIPNKINNKTVSQKPGVFQIKISKPAVTPKPIKFITVTHKPIVINLTKVPSNFSNSLVITHPTMKTTRTPGWISKIKSTTPIPTSSTKSNSFGWPNNRIKNKNDWNRYKNYTELNLSKKPNSGTRRKPATPSTTSNKKKKPTRVKYVPKPGHKPTIEEIKQNWYESGVPYPNPMPEISSNSPTFPLPPIEEPPTGADSDAVQLDAAEDNPLTNAISTFNLDMRPAASNLKDSIGVDGSGCPTVHISSSVLSPQQRQGCSDLNLVINSHFHQNTASDRTPSIDTYQAENPEEDVPVEAVEDPVEEGADAGVGQADPAAPQADPIGAQADSAGGSPGSGGTGGSGASGGNGGNGGDGSNGGMGWPDIKGMLDAIDWVGNKFGGILNFLKNPYLYLVPATLFFLIGFFLILALFPWWIPLLFLFIGIKAKPKPQVLHHKHVHKAVHHPDGWFWNHQTKTWENVQDYLHRRRIDNINLNHIPQAIDQFGKKYALHNPALKLVKRSR
ncbi:uncharacterized protein LOC123308974 isoform X1 [Coccinella septempunctata]|uniref:uncharacterized protein LOC123308974 isoform X1 n=1 Tax=Coccinella septempunctata TaxID=41139 RepID=UPI001D090249|nr:uncharacterized protein LOC123308974 isoform X1 [Coccinella septempunctata]